MKILLTKKLNSNSIFILNFIKAFTLAEIMIVLTVIGVLTAILLPVAIQSSPDENVMKFKKGNATLGKVISELVNNDKYYADGDLGKYPNGNDVDSNGFDRIYKVFCMDVDGINKGEDPFGYGIPVQTGKF